jgi:DNA-binding XRE family transcriptional regulator
MTDLPPKMQARRAIEDRAVQLGTERRNLSGRLEANTHAIMQLLRDTEGTGVTYDYLAHLTGVSRQTLYRWRDEVAMKLQPGETAAEMLSKRTPEGHFLHYKG